MIVTTGRIVKVECGNFLFERTSEAPGIVTVTQRQTHDLVRAQVGLPTHAGEAERFIEAYRRCLNEDVGYRKSEVE